MKRVVVIGNKGQIGGAIEDMLSKKPAWEVRGVDKVQLDITRERAVQEYLSAKQPHAVVLTAANANVDEVEEQRAEAYATNVEGVKHVGQWCKASGAKLIFFSSGYVFDGKEGEYTEESKPNPVNYYGATKLEAEQWIQANLANVIIIRAMWVFDMGYDTKNFLAQLVAELRAGKEMRVPQDQVGNPTLARTIAQAVKEMIAKDMRGLYHIAGKDAMNKYEWAQALAKHFGLRGELVHAGKTAGLGQRAVRPLRCSLVCAKAERELSTPLLSLQESLKFLAPSV